MKRTDIHCEANFKPEDYRYTGYYDAYPDYPMSEDELKYKRHLIDELIKSRNSGNGSVHGLGQCAHCGARIRYHIVFEHIPTGALIAVGQDCADGRFQWSDWEFKNWKKDVTARRAKAREVGKFQVWKDADPRNAECAEFLTGDEIELIKGNISDFVWDVRERMLKYKGLSEKQVVSILKIRDKNREFRAKREADRIANPLAPVVEGKGIEITGTIVGIKLVQNNFGPRVVYAWQAPPADILKITVKDDRGFIVWGTCPESLFTPERGMKVRFVANVTASDKDNTFGFFKRPRKMVVLD